MDLIDSEAPYPDGCGPDCKGCDPCECGHPWSDHDSARDRVCCGDWCDCKAFDSKSKTRVFFGGFAST